MLMLTDSQHDHHTRNWLVERALWTIYEALGLHNSKGETGWAEWYELAAAGEWQ
jgi:hypothetical protein